MSLDIRLARIDDRLIHGQVATVWSKQTDVQRILVISDAVAKDQLRKFLLKEAAPPGLHAHVIPVSKMLAIYEDPHFAAEKVMLLFTNPEDVATLVKAGVKLTTLNIGGMSYSVGKRMLTNFVSVDDQDVAAFQYLANQNIELEIRKVPADRKVYLLDLLAKEKSSSSL